MSTGRKIAEGMAEFAQGLFSAGTNNARKKMAGRAASKIINEGGAASKRAAIREGYKIADQMMKKDTYKMGEAIGNAKLFSGIADSFKEKELGATAFEAIKKGHMVNGNYSAKKIAGTAFTVGVAGRVATGGGLYRDRYGNFNLPGVPFI